MPIYEYGCPKCGKIFEEWLKPGEADAGRACPECGQAASRLISNTSFILKGGGWYLTEYGSHKDAAKAENQPEDGAGKAGGAGESPDKSGRESASPPPAKAVESASDANTQA